MTNAWRASDRRVKRLSLPVDAVPRARRLRRDMTPQERKLWRALREAFPKAHFRHQVPLGRYTVDFAWHTAKLIIEVDGGQHGAAKGLTHDAARTLFLEGEGYRIIRFWNNEIDDNLEGVLTTIADSLPLVGRVGWGPAASAAEGTGSAPPASESFARQTPRAPTLSFPQGGGMAGVRPMPFPQNSGS